MSAFVVEDKTINNVVGFLNDSRNRDLRKIVLEAAQLTDADERWHEKLGASMAIMNQDAVNQRYGENDEAHYEFHFELLARTRDGAWSKGYRQFCRQHPEVLERRLSIGGAVTTR